MPAKFFSRYEIVDRLGEGAQSKVYLVRDTLNQNVLKAAKVIKRQNYARGLGKELIEEFQLLESVDHTNLVRVFDCRFLPQDQAPVIITEYVQGAWDLEGYLLGGIKLSFSKKLQIAYQVLSALRYLHQKKIIHGDLKPANILISPEHPSSGDPIGYPRVKLIDFGVSQDLFVSHEKKCVGTPYYIAPEVVTDGLIPASDLYSFGVILYKLFISPNLPYKGMKPEEILQAHMADQPLFQEMDFLEVHVSESLLSLMRRCLDSDPLARPRRLGEILRQLRFDFPNALTSMPPSSMMLGDSRLRPYLGSKENLEFARIFLGGHFKGEKQFVSSRLYDRPLLFVNGPSGQGKTRYLKEVAKICQREKINHQFINYRAVDFWDHAVRNIMECYKGSPVTKRLRGKLLQAMQSVEQGPRQLLFSRYLHNLALELGGLVLFVDGLNQQLPSAFLNMLKAMARGPSRHRTKEVEGQEHPRKRASRLVLILSVNARSWPEAKGDESEISQNLSDLVSSLHESVLENRKGEWPEDSFDSTPRFEQEVPEPIRSLGTEGLAHVLLLSSWQAQEVAFFLSEVFPGQQFSQEFMQKLLSATKGNPGFLQAVSSEVLETLKKVDEITAVQIQDHLLQALVHLQVQDLQVYKLKYYDDKGKTLLSFLAALETCNLSLMEQVWGKVFGELSQKRVHKILIRAFDDGIIQVEGEKDYSLLNQNVKFFLQKESKDAFQSMGLLLRKILVHAKDLLSSRKRIFLAEFLDQRRIWAEAILEFFNAKKTTPERLSIGPSLSHLREALHSSPEAGGEVGGDQSLSLDYVAAILFLFQWDYEEAEHLTQGILESLRERNDAFANGLRAKSLLHMGTLNRSKGKLKEAVPLFQDALETELLSDADHYYALGSMSLCQLRLLQEDQEGEREILDSLNEARKILRPKDPIRYAILTNSLGNYLVDQQQYQRAIPYLEHCSRIYGEHGDLKRKITVQTCIGKAHFLLKRYKEALAILNRSLQMAERLNLNYDSAEILIYIIRTYFHMGEVRKLGPVLLHLTSICEQLQEYRPLMSIIEPVVMTYLEEGNIDRALEMVQAQMERLEGIGDHQRGFDMVICGLLLVHINQRKWAWKKAEEQSQKVYRKIKELISENFRTKRALEAHLIYHVEFLYHEKSPEVALKELEQNLGENKFSGFGLLEARFKALELAVWAQDNQRVQKYMPSCVQGLKKVNDSQKMLFYGVMGKYYLDGNELKLAKKSLRQALTCFHSVRNPLFHAQVLDQQARLLARQDKREMAFKNWNRADEEFQKYLLSLETEGREYFKEKSCEWQEHRVIYEILQNEPSDALGRTNSGGG